MAKWKVYDHYDTPQCTTCGMWAPFARYRRGNGTNARELTDYCPCCGERMSALPICEQCSYAKDGNWKDDGICYACREKTWIPQRPHRKVGEEK